MMIVEISLIDEGGKKDPVIWDFKVSKDNNHGYCFNNNGQNIYIAKAILIMKTPVKIQNRLFSNVFSSVFTSIIASLYDNRVVENLLEKIGFTVMKMKFLYNNTLYLYNSSYGGYLTMAKVGDVDIELLPDMLQHLYCKEITNYWDTRYNIEKIMEETEICKQHIYSTESPIWLDSLLWNAEEIWFDSYKPLSIYSLADFENVDEFGNWQEEYIAGMYF